jgi:hypothetical protein
MTCPAVVKVSIPGAPAVVKVTAPAAPAVVRVATPGPPGVSGDGATQLGSLVDVDVGGRVNNSLLFYSAASQKFKADSSTTTLTLTDGGNF